MDFFSSTNRIVYSTDTSETSATTDDNYTRVNSKFNGEFAYRFGRQRDGQWVKCVEGYSFEYSQKDIARALGKHRYFLSWYNPSQAEPFFLIKPDDIPYKVCDRLRLDHKPPITIKRALAGYKNVGGDPARAMDLHCYPNFPLQITDWDEWDALGRPTFKKTKGARVDHKFVESVIATSSYYDNEVKGWVNSGNKSEAKEAAQQIKRFKDEYVVIGGRYEQKHYYCVIDIDGTDIPSEVIFKRAKDLGACAVANTSVGRYHILFKSLRVNADGSRPTYSFQNPCMRALLAFHLLGLRLPDIDLLGEDTLPEEVMSFLEDQGIDRSYLRLDCNDMLFRVIGSWNYKRSFRVVGCYFDKPLCYSDAEFIALASGVKKKKVKVTKPKEAKERREREREINNRALIIHTNDSKITTRNYYQRLHEGDPEYALLKQALAPAFKSKKSLEKWATVLFEDRYFLSCDTPAHGLGMAATAGRIGAVSYTNVQPVLHRLVRDGFLICDEKWDHPFKAGKTWQDPKGKGRTKRYCFGERLAQFKVDMNTIPLNDIPYSRHKSRDGIIRDAIRLRKAKMSVADIIEFIDNKYRSYVSECDPPEIRSLGDIKSIVQSIVRIID